MLIFIGHLYKCGQFHFRSNCAYRRTSGRQFDQKCVRCQSMKVSDTVVRHSSTQFFESRQNHVALQFLSKLLSRRHTPTVLSATFTVSRGKRRRTIPHTEYAPLGENPTQEQTGSPSSAWKTLCVFRNLKAQNPTLVGKKFVVKQSSKEKTSQRKLIPKQCGKASERQLPFPLSRTSNQTFSSSWTPLSNAWWFRTAQGDLLLEDDHFESFKTRRRGMVSRETQSWQRTIKQKLSFSPTLCLGVWEEARCGKLQEILKTRGWENLQEGG